MLPDSNVHIRILPELRSAQIERGFVTTPCRVLYFGKNFDLGATKIPSNYERVNLWRACLALFSSRTTVLETAEPLWVRFLPTNMALIAAWKLGGLVRRTRRFTVCFAIENNDVDDVLFGQVRASSGLRRFARTLLSFWIKRTFDRIAFGTDGAEQTYGSLALDSRTSTQVWVDLPARQQVMLPGSDGANAIFVGQLEARKGLYELMAQWPSVEANIASAKLTIVGDGELNDVVRSWCDVVPSRRIMIGRLEHSLVLGVIAKNSVLVAPSIRSGRWREQIGLPIVEALSLGLTIVTTDETGLAPWLAEQGHTVLSAETLAETLATSVSAALAEPLDRNRVLSSLPAVAERIRSDVWIHSIAENAAGSANAESVLS